MVETLKIKEFLSKIPQYINIKDVLMLIGVIMAGKGLYMIFPAAMWLILGIFIIYLGWPKKAVK